MTTAACAYVVLLAWLCVVGVAFERARDDTWRALWRELARRPDDRRTPRAVVVRG